MNGLQETFYVMGIIFMGLMFLLMLGLLAAVLVIRAKINKIHDNIEHKLSLLTSVAERSGELSAMAGAQVFKQAKKAFMKKTKK